MFDSFAEHVEQMFYQQKFNRSSRPLRAVRRTFLINNVWSNIRRTNVRRDPGQTFDRTFIHILHIMYIFVHYVHYLYTFCTVCTLFLLEHLFGWKWPTKLWNNFDRTNLFDEQKFDSFAGPFGRTFVRLRLARKRVEHMFFEQPCSSIICSIRLHNVQQKLRRTNVRSSRKRLELLLIEHAYIIVWLLKNNRWRTLYKK